MEWKEPYKKLQKYENTILHFKVLDVEPQMFDDGVEVTIQCCEEPLEGEVFTLFVHEK